MNQEESEQNEVDGMKKEADSTGKVTHCIYKRAVGDFVMRKTQNGRARVTANKVRVLRVD